MVGPKTKIKATGKRKPEAPEKKAEAKDIPRPELSTQAKEIIDALQRKPGLLQEVASHFAHGWPVENLAGPWEVVAPPLCLPAFARPRVSHALSKEEGFGACASVQPLMDPGFDGDQWVGTFLTKDDKGEDVVHRRVFNIFQEAMGYTDDGLEQAGFLLAPYEDLTALHEKFQDLAETRTREIKDEIVRRNEEEKELQRIDDLPF